MNTQNETAARTVEQAFGRGTKLHVAKPNFLRRTGMALAQVAAILALGVLALILLMGAVVLVLKIAGWVI